MKRASRTRIPAVQAEALYLVNLLLAPGLAFLLLWLLFRRHRDSADPLAAATCGRPSRRQPLAGLLLVGGRLRSSRCSATWGSRQPGWS